MSTRPAVNLDTYSLSLLTAKEDILNPRSSTNWALFTYDGVTNKLKLADSGAGGVAELAGKFHISKPQYGLCKVGSIETGGPRIAMIIWVGQNVEEYRRTECASHIPTIKNFFKFNMDLTQLNLDIAICLWDDLSSIGFEHVLKSPPSIKCSSFLKVVSIFLACYAACPSWQRGVFVKTSLQQQIWEAHAFVMAEKVEDVTEEKIKADLSKAQVQAPAQWVRRSSRSADKEELVGTNYRKTNAAMEMRLINRDSFWARAEREEEDRKEEERRRAAEERRRLERERIMKERRDAEERDRKMNEKLQLIEEQRRKQAEQEEELRRQEKLRWEQQQREHEEFMRARLRRSESIEKAAEAAALVSQRSMNPREFFRQLSSSSSQSPTSPGSSRTGKPFRRYQRSLTDTAFIFSKAEESSASSPRSSPLVSPFFRAPPSPLYRTTSPPTSPDFRPVTSPLGPRAHVSQPTSPVRPAPPVSALPSVLQTNTPVQAVVEPKPPSPTEPSAPPASPTLLASLSPSLVKNNPPQSHPEALPASPPNTPTQPEDSAFCFEPALAPQAPTAPLPERPQLNTDFDTSVHTEQVTESSFKVQAVLVEEDEEEDEEEEHEEHMAETQPQPCPVTTEPVQTEAEEQEEKEEEKEQEQDEEEEEEVEEEEEEEKRLNQEAMPALVEEPVEVVQEEEETKVDEEENDQSEDIQPPAELSEKEEESAVTERSLSPSDTELSSPELAVCYDLHGTAEEDDVIEEKEQEISENGQKVLAERQMCVRALYDYQAEDESEISFEPGDIIRDVETVDKAWWRGWSKDGRQGLFPANYVETI
ncbi:hypothetical protein L3Q82_022971 [Scortum barcoo]|uniref:Uncharacterized protein n=1 Tax=Scortum barcoo TaxID=214431 RepID=A0ACB8WWQ9_9TELE|nr:hypothetical protein L3Q82_022971 [Scortum barcoo]